ncbi:MAG: hypothetical protein P8Y93_10340, partial [Acidobacteriota bacterium]
IVPATTAVQATLLDIAPTLLDLMGLGVPNDFEGISWAQAARGGIQPEERTLCFQAHKGAVHGGSHDSDKARSGGLLEVGVVSGQTKETYRVRGANLSLYDLEADPGELVNLSPSGASPSKELAACLARVSSGLGSLDHLAARKLDDETVEQLRALGYLE